MILVPEDERKLKRMKWTQRTIEKLMRKQNAGGGLRDKDIN